MSSKKSKLNLKKEESAYLNDSILFLFDPGSVRDKAVRKEIMEFAKKAKSAGIPILVIYYKHKKMNKDFLPFGDYYLKIKVRKNKPLCPPYKLVGKKKISFSSLKLPLKRSLKIHKLEFEGISDEYSRKATDIILTILKKSGKNIILVMGQTADGCQRDFLKYLPEYMNNPPHLVFFPTLSRTLDEDREGKKDSPKERIKKWVSKSEREIFTSADIFKNPADFLELLE